MHLQAPPNLSDPTARRARRRRHRRLGRRLARHARPREPRAAVARARRAARRDRGGGQGARAAPHRVPRVRRATPRRWLAPRRAVRGARRVRLRRRSPATTPGPPAATRRPADAPPGPIAAPVPRRRRLAGRRGARRRARRRGGRRRRDRHAARGARLRGRAGSPRSPTSCGATIVGDVVTFVRNRNINYTNICTFKCRFCAFSKGPLSLNLRGDPYLLDLEEIQRRVVEAVECGATEVCLQGGIHPDFDGDYYLVVARAVKEVAPDDPRARLHRARGHRRRAPARRCRSRDYLALAKDAGLVDAARHRGRDPRRRGARGDLPRQGEHRGVARGAPHSRTRSACARTSRSCSAPSSARSTSPATSCAPATLQKETGGFTEFVPLPFVHMATPIFLQQQSRRGPTFREVLLMHAVGRIAYRGWIDNIQVSWAKAGSTARAQALRAGCNDLGGTLMDENISRAAGAEPRPGARRRRLPRDRRAARPTARAAHHALRAHHHRGPPAAPAATHEPDARCRRPGHASRRARRWPVTT